MKATRTTTEYRLEMLVDELGLQADSFEYLKSHGWTFEAAIGSKVCYNAYHNGDLVYGRFDDLGQVVRLAIQRESQANH